MHIQDYVFDNINLDQKKKFLLGKLQFNELTWWYCSSGANQIDRSVIQLLRKCLA